MALFFHSYSLLNIALTLGAAFLSSIRCESASGMSHVSNLTLECSEEKTQTIHQKNSKWKKRTQFIWIFTSSFFYSIDKKHLEQMQSDLLEPTDRRGGMLKESRFDAQAVMETSPLSGSQAERAGPTANFLFPRTWGTFTAPDSKVRGEVAGGRGAIEGREAATMVQRILLRIWSIVPAGLLRPPPTRHRLTQGWQPRCPQRLDSGEGGGATGLARNAGFCWIVDLINCFFFF